MLQSYPEHKVVKTCNWELYLLGLISFVNMILYIHQQIKRKTSIGRIHPLNRASSSFDQNVYTISGNVLSPPVIVAPIPSISSPVAKPKETFPIHLFVLYGVMKISMEISSHMEEDTWSQDLFQMITIILRRFNLYILPLYWISKSDDALEFGKLKIYQVVLKICQKINSAAFDYTAYLQILLLQLHHSNCSDCLNWKQKHSERHEQICINMFFI